ncbi:glutathione peroxidase [Pseudaestuariivita rosea]|uniref:glutathione peroxidase n=1 Tax=Pseudaestuariivita rosea TaxID=2763263 RepID=UPI0030141243
MRFWSSFWLGLGVLLSVAVLTAPAFARSDFKFSSIDGGQLSFREWSGRPILVVNTASLCGFVGQFDGLQTLYDQYRDQGLVVLAIPSNDFRQELGSEEDVKDFCDVNFDLDLPMSEITPVLGADAHPFYQWLRSEHGFVPNWNFNKVLIGPDGDMVDTWRSPVRPMSSNITTRIEPLLP